MSNQLNVGYTAIADPKRGIPGGQAFPFIEVLEPDASGNLLYYTALGNELFTVGNLLENNVFNITDNYHMRIRRSNMLIVEFSYVGIINISQTIFCT